MKKSLKSLILGGLITTVSLAAVPSLSSASPLLDDRVSASTASRVLDAKIKNQIQESEKEPVYVDIDSIDFVATLQRIYSTKDYVVFQDQLLEFPSRSTFFSVANIDVDNNGKIYPELEMFSNPNYDHDSHLVPPAMNCPWVAEFIGARNGDYSDVSIWYDKTQPQSIQFQNHKTGEKGFLTSGFTLHKTDRYGHSGTSKGMTALFTNADEESTLKIVFDETPRQKRDRFETMKDQMQRAFDKVANGFAESWTESDKNWKNHHHKQH